MGNLEDIIERNRRAPRGLPSLTQLLVNEVRVITDRRTPMHERKRKALAMGLMLAIVGVLVGWLLIARHDRQVARRVAQRTWVMDPNGVSASLAELWRDRPALIVFYPTFACEGCEAQLREVQAIAREHQLTVAAVVFDRNGLELMRAALGPELPLYLASHEKINAWGIPWELSDNTGPAMFLVARDGEVTYHRTCKDYYRCSIRTELAPAFAATKP